MESPFFAQPKHRHRMQWDEARLAQIMAERHCQRPYAIELYKKERAGRPLPGLRPTRTVALRDAKPKERKSHTKYHRPKGGHAFSTSPNHTGNAQNEAREFVRWYSRGVMSLEQIRAHLHITPQQRVSIGKVCSMQAVHSAIAFRARVSWHFEMLIRKKSGTRVQSRVFSVIPQGKKATGDLHNGCSR